MPIHVGDGFSQGENGGEFSHTLIAQELPSHNHSAQGVSTVATNPGATGDTWAVSIQNPYSTTPNTSLGPTALSTTGGSQATGQLAAVDEWERLKPASAR
jgi:microcystin-dependent protein